MSTNARIDFGDCYFRFPRNHRAGHIYMLRRRTDYLVKIGLTDNVPRRIHELQRVYGVLDLIHSIDTSDTLWAEQWIHTCLQSCRVEGEWFDLPDAARMLLQAMNRVDPPDSDEGSQELYPHMRWRRCEK